MSNHEKAIEKIIELANKHGLEVLSLSLKDENHAFVAATSIESLILSAKLIEVSLENIPEEALKEACNCPNCSPKENKFFQLMHDSFPGLLDTMPDEIRQQFVEKFKGKSDKSQEQLFEKTFPVLQMFNNILNMAK